MFMGRRGSGAALHGLKRGAQVSGPLGGAHQFQKTLFLIGTNQDRGGKRINKV